MNNPTIKHFDVSSITEIPEAARWMSDSETMVIFAWPEPEDVVHMYNAGDDEHFTIQTGSWFAEITTRDFHNGYTRDMGGDWCLGSDIVTYEEEEDEDNAFRDSFIDIGYTDRYPSHWND